MPSRIAVVVNPERADLADDVVTLLTIDDVPPDVRRPTEAADLADAIDGAIADGADVVAVVGGDGSQRTAAERLAGTDAALLVVPGGTVNLLAQVLGTAELDDLQPAVRDGQRRTIDLADADGRVFVLNATSGWDASVIARADDDLKRFGRVGFAVAGIWEWVRSAPEHLVVTVDDEVAYEGPAMTAMVLNVGERASASLHLAPDAAIDDGRLDVVVMRRAAFRSLLRTGWAIVRGHRPPERDIAVMQGADVRLEWAHEVRHQVDGDGIGTARVLTYRALPGALHVLVPRP